MALTQHFSQRNPGLYFQFVIGAAHIHGHLTTAMSHVRMTIHVLGHVKLHLDLHPRLHGFRVGINFSHRIQQCSLSHIKGVIKTGHLREVFGQSTGLGADGSRQTSTQRGAHRQGETVCQKSLKSFIACWHDLYPLLGAQELDRDALDFYRNYK